MENTLWNRTTDISKTSRTPVILLACSAAVLLASCSAGPADGTAAGSSASPQPSTSSAVPSPSAESEPLGAPLSPESKLSPYPPEELVLSEKGTGTGNYVIEGGLKEGQYLTLAVHATCPPGEKIALRTEPAIGGISNHSCGNLPFVMYNRASAVAVPDLEVAVETSAGGTFWVQARVSDDATVVETKASTGQ